MAAIRSLRVSNVKVWESADLDVCPAASRILEGGMDTKKLYGWVMKDQAKPYRCSW